MLLARWKVGCGQLLAIRLSKRSPLLRRPSVVPPSIACVRFARAQRVCALEQPALALSFHAGMGIAASVAAGAQAAAPKSSTTLRVVGLGDALTEVEVTLTAAQLAKLGLEPESSAEVPP